MIFDYFYLENTLCGFSFYARSLSKEASFKNPQVFGSNLSNAVHSVLLVKRLTIYYNQEKKLYYLNLMRYSHASE